MRNQGTVLAACVAICQAASAVPPTAEQVVADALRARKGVTRYHLVMTVRMSTAVRGEPTLIQRQRWEVWSDAGRLRTDRTMLEHTKTPNEVGQRSVVCRDCERAGYATTTNQGPNYLTPVQYPQLDAKFDATDITRVDWRMFGLLNAALNMYIRDPNDAFLRAIGNFKQVTVKAVSLDGGLPGTELTGVSASGTTFTARFSPEQSGNPVYYRMADGPPGGGPADMEQETRTEYRLVQPANVWFPSRSTFRVGGAGDGVAHLDHEWVFETAELNAPIDPVVFTLAGMGLADGTPVELPEVADRSAQPTWQQGRLDDKATRGKQAAAVYRQMLAEGAATDPAPARTMVRWPYLLGAAVLAAVGLGFLVRGARRRDSRDRSAPMPPH